MLKSVKELTAENAESAKKENLMQISQINADKKLKIKNREINVVSVKKRKMN